jgi:hypothetical protein
MAGKSHETDSIVTRSSELSERIAALAEYVEANRSVGQRHPFQESEQRIRELTASIETAATAIVLEQFEPTAKVVEYQGRQYRRLNQANEATYYGMVGGLRVSRHLYREVGVRNGPTIVPLEINAGIVEGLATPLAAKAAAFLLQALPSREAEETARQLGVLTMSRSTLIRVTEAVGRRWEENRLDGENHLLEKMEVPSEAVAVSVSTDRVSVPMEEPRSRPRGRPRKGAAKRPVDVVYRMAYCGVLTLYDEEGEPLRSIRYGRMPGARAATEIESSLAGDLHGILGERPDLRVVTLADGAREMQNMLDNITNGLEVEARMLDFWHVVEKLADAVSSTGRDAKPKLSKWKRALRNDDHAIERIDVELRTWAIEYEDDLPAGLYDALTYIENNRDRMRYATVRAAHLPIGSGHVEATCKTIVSTRMKRCGARWKRNGGQTVMHLRSLATSSRWEDAADFVLSTYVEEAPPRTECA